MFKLIGEVRHRLWLFLRPSKFDLEILFACNKPAVFIKDLVHLKFILKSQSILLELVDEKIDMFFRNFILLAWTRNHKFFLNRYAFFH